MSTIDRNARVYVAGHRGLVGSAMVRHLRAQGFTEILTATREQVDLRDQSEVSHWFKANRPDYVFLVAGTVGGILANSTRPAEFIYDNMMIHGTVVHASHLYDVTKLLYLGSSCIYPRQATQPITEEQLLTGPLEPTNEWYAVAKIAGIKLCQAYRQQYGHDFISAMPTNLYGRTTTSTSPAAMCCRPSCASSTMPRPMVRRQLRSGVPGRRCASSCTSMTWPTPACIS